MTEWIDSAEAARRLGVQPATLYAYVSRGVLRRRRAADGRRSLFDPAEVDELAGRGRPRRPQTKTELVVESAITALGPDRPYYRGRDALRLAADFGPAPDGFERVAAWLWTGEPAALDLPARWLADPAARAAGYAAQAGLPAGVLPLDRLQVIVAALAAADPLRFHLDRPGVVALGQSLIAGMVDALPLAAAGPAGAGPAGPDGAGTGPVRADLASSGPAGAGPAGRDGAGADLAGPGPGGADLAGADFAGPDPANPGPVGAGSVGADGAGAGPVGADGVGAGPVGADGVGGDPAAAPAGIAERLWARLCPLTPRAGLRTALAAALIVLADHELAASTLAARVAASVRADPYAVVAAGLGVVSGPLHGGASLGVEKLLAEVADPAEASRAIGERLRRGERIPGFGHTVYRDQDGRCTFVLDLIEAAVPDSDRLAAAGAVLAEARRRRLPEPNIDFAIGTLTAVAGMDAGAGQAIFAVARAAGWFAHALEEYERGTLIRPRAHYIGPPVDG